MCSLSNFPESRNRKLVYKNAFSTDVALMINPETVSHPNIAVRLLKHNQQLLFSTISRLTISKKCINKRVDNDFQASCEEVGVLIYFKHLYQHVMMISSLTCLLGFKNSILPNISKTKLWSSSVLRCMSWHPHSTILAVSSSRDVIFVYNQTNAEVRIINSSQCVILSLAWRPLSIGTLAVGCEKGIFIWIVEFNSSHVKSKVVNVCKFIKDDHRFITGLSWNKMGDLLVSCAMTSTTMYVWNYPLKTNVPLHRIGSDTLNFVYWSPDNTKIFCCSTNETFRIWSTDKWISENWVLKEKSRVQCACWSPCSLFLLFATDICPVVNAIDFQEVSEYSKPHKNKKFSWPVIDFKNEFINNKIIGDKLSDMCWDQNGNYLAITFKNNGVLVVFKTSISEATVDCIPFCTIRGHLDEHPSTIGFQPNCKKDSLLTIGWSNGNIEYIPFLQGCKTKPKLKKSASNFGYLNSNKNRTGLNCMAVNSSIEYLLN